MSGKSHHVRKVESCSLVWTGDKEPVDYVRDFLRSKGVRVGRIDRTRNVITGRIGSWASFDSFKVTAQVFPQTDVCLVVLSCVATRKREADTLEDSLRRLRRNLDDVRLVDEHGYLDWQKRTSQGMPAKKRDSGPITIPRKINTRHG